jgi:hypothetical protein
MKSRTSQILLRYWNDVRGPRVAPHRLEIEPGRFTTALAESFILERSPTDGFTFRLAGTRICEDFGWELRGTDYLDLAGASADILREDFDVITAEGAYGVFEFKAVAADGRAVMMESIVLPLMHTHERITRYLGAISVLDRSIWVGTLPLSPVALVRNELHWPDGRVRTSAPQEVEPALSLEGLGPSARIVRRDRRQFRVLDGGRANTGDAS